MPRSARTSAQPSARRSLQSIMAAVALTALFSGCSGDVAGSAGPSVRPVAAPVSAPDPAAIPTTGPTAEPMDVYAEWMAAGWSPAPLTPVTDTASGISASMFGPAELEPSDPASTGSRSYRSMSAPASVVTYFIVSPQQPGAPLTAADAVTSVAAAQGREVSGMQPVTVAGYSGVDVRFDMASSGEASVDMLRVVATPDHLVVMESVGYAYDDRVVQQVQAIISETLRFP